MDRLLTGLSRGSMDAKLTAESVAGEERVGTGSPELLSGYGPAYVPRPCLSGVWASAHLVARMTRR